MDPNPDAVGEFITNAAKCDCNMKRYWFSTEVRLIQVPKFFKHSDALRWRENKRNSAYYDQMKVDFQLCKQFAVEVVFICRKCNQTYQFTFEWSHSGAKKMRKGFYRNRTVVDQGSEYYVKALEHSYDWFEHAFNSMQNEYDPYGLQSETWAREFYNIGECERH
ncbi:hypothetical protein DdX_01834 [Ditylenchus destructor]|uniref:Uncharacterized protein n=1 Tax=Ditylenchus destructor TaxID=166010 RepID=A0AAD4NK39_9BILA|nr:hypothetical protein DdX_01834 [Ditylenchus destructor]